MSEINGQTSDGFHTFDELYAHRHALFIALCGMIAEFSREHCRESDVWRSKVHSNGSTFPGWFVLGIRKQPGLQITYHLPLELWSKTEFAQTLEFAPEFDGHTSEDVLDRLGRL